MTVWRAKKALYPVAEVADLLSYHRDTVYNLVMIGELLCHNRTPGRKGMRIVGASIEAYVERHALPVGEGFLTENELEGRAS